MMMPITTIVTHHSPGMCPPGSIMRLADRMVYMRTGMANGTMYPVTGMTSTGTVLCCGLKGKEQQHHQGQKDVFHDLDVFTTSLTE